MILVGVDGSEASIHALEWAHAFAERSGESLAVHVTWMYPAALDLPAEVSVPSKMSAQVLASVHDAVAEAGFDPANIDFSVSETTASTGLLSEAEKRGASLIVVGTRGYGPLRRAFLGSTSRYLASRSPVPVAIVPDGAPLDYPEHPVVVGVDGSANAVAALQWAVDQDFEHVDALHVWDMTYFYTTPILPLDLFEQTAKAVLAETIDGVTDERSDRVHAVLRRGDPRAELVARAEAGSLIVVGKRGRGPMAAAVLGSVAHHVAGHSSAAVVVVPGP